MVSLEGSAKIERRHRVSVEERYTIVVTEMQKAGTGLCEKPVFSIALAGADAKQAAGLSNYGGVQGEPGNSRDVVLPVSEFGIEREVLVEIVVKPPADPPAPFANSIQVIDVGLHAHFVPGYFLVMLQLSAKPLWEQASENQRE